MRTRKRSTLFSGCLSHNRSSAYYALTFMNSTSRALFALLYCQLNNDDFEPWHDGQAKWTCPTPEMRGVTMSLAMAQGALELLSPLSRRENVPGPNSPLKPQPLLESLFLCSCRVRWERKMVGLAEALSSSACWEAG